MCGLLLLLSAGVTQLRLRAALGLLQYGFCQFVLHRFGLEKKRNRTLVIILFWDMLKLQN